MASSLLKKGTGPEPAYAHSAENGGSEVPAPLLQKAACWLYNLRNRSVTVRIAVLTMVVLVVFGLVGPVAFHIGGLMGLAAAVLAASLCLAGGGIALMVSRLLLGPNLALAALMTSMTARMAIPLAFGLAIHLHGGPLAKAGLLYYLLVFYPVTLAVETMLSLPPAAKSKGPAPETAKM
jgi:hypothetical protein